MSKTIRVLLAEDSLTDRELLKEILQTDPSISVVGEAKDGIEALAMTKRLMPDIITMDILMPKMDGFEATKRIMIEAPTPIIIVSGKPDINSMTVCMHALSLGALTVVRKPMGPASPDFDKACATFIKNLKAMAGVKVIRRHDRAPLIPKPTLVQAHSSKADPQLVAIAASTGGPPALQVILSRLPRDFRLPILVVQHMGRGFIEGFVKWLDYSCPLTVKLAEHGEYPKPSTVYVAPDDSHLGVLPDGRLAIVRSPPIDGFQPSASHLFASLAETMGSATLAVILTGMGRDGLQGLRKLSSAGGTIIAQDEKSSVVWGMPGVVVRENLAGRVVPLELIAEQIMNEVCNENDQTRKASSNR